MYGEFRRCLAWLNHKTYRGISRGPLGDQVYGAENGNNANEFALRRLAQVTPASTLELCDDCFIDRYEDALEIYGLLDEPKSWEIIEVLQSDFRLDSRTFGFDVGYWRSDHFSLIADTAICPTWHPPAPRDWDELSNRLRHLNNHALFESVAEAEEFRTYYRSKEWAETEDVPGEFAVIEVRGTGVLSTG